MVRSHGHMVCILTITWSAYGFAEGRLREVMGELAFNLESFNPAFTAVLLKVQPLYCSTPISAIPLVPLTPPSLTLVHICTQSHMQEHALVPCCRAYTSASTVVLLNGQLGLTAVQLEVQPSSVEVLNVQPCLAALLRMTGTLGFRCLPAPK
jgi:hypothetical protein